MEKVESESHMKNEMERIKTLMNKYTSKETVVHRAKGLHGNMLNQENAEYNAEIIQESLNS